MSHQHTVLPISNIHSKQPWFVLNASKFLTHRNLDNPMVSHYYRFEAGENASCRAIAIPDGCIDLMFDCDQDTPSVQVCGTCLQAKDTTFYPRHHYFGVRFLPGIIPDFVDLSATDLIEQEIDFMAFAPKYRHVFTQVLEQADFANQVRLTSSFLRHSTPHKHTSLTYHIIALICQFKGNIQIQELERKTGYCSRTIQRLFRADTGLTPKKFCRVIRCQSAVYGLNHDNTTFSDLAYELGFSDQSHFLREFKALVSATPLEYLKQVKHQSYQERIQCF